MKDENLTKVSNRLLTLILILVVLSAFQGAILLVRNYYVDTNPVRLSNIVLDDEDFPGNSEDPKTQTNIDEQAFISYTRDVEPNGSLKFFVSPKLKVEFQYLSENRGEKFKVTEVGNKLYIHSENQAYNAGQYIEVFEGYGRKTLTNILKDRFLSDDSFRANCEAVSDKLLNTGSSRSYPETYQIANIKVKGEVADVDDLFTKLKNCPTPYTQANGISYFLFDSEHLGKYAFVNVGQYMIPADENMSIGWQDTIRFID